MTPREKIYRMHKSLFSLLSESQEDIGGGVALKAGDLEISSCTHIVLV